MNALHHVLRSTSLFKCAHQPIQIYFLLFDKTTIPLSLIARNKQKMTSKKISKTKNMVCLLHSAFSYEHTSVSHCFFLYNFFPNINPQEYEPFTTKFAEVLREYANDLEHLQSSHCSHGRITKAKDHPSQVLQSRKKLLYDFQVPQVCKG